MGIHWLPMRIISSSFLQTHDKITNGSGAAGSIWSLSSMFLIIFQLLLISSWHKESTHITLTKVSRYLTIMFNVARLIWKSKGKLKRNSKMMENAHFHRIKLLNGSEACTFVGFDRANSWLHRTRVWETCAINILDDPSWIQTKHLPMFLGDLPIFHEHGLPNVPNLMYLLTTSTIHHSIHHNLCLKSKKVQVGTFKYWKANN